MSAFLLSPARCDGRRAQMLLNPDASFALAEALRSDAGASIGDVFAFLSGLYFRGKLAYARTFASWTTYVITTDRGLVPPEERVRVDDIRAFARVDLARAGETFLNPLRRDAERLAGEDRVVLLGSIASTKYVEPLLRVFGDRLLFPGAFIGRGDMSRGGLLLRHAADKAELEYVPVASAARRGKRPPKLAPLRKP
jgi:hypothetical protein